MRSKVQGISKEVTRGKKGQSKQFAEQRSSIIRISFSPFSSNQPGSVPSLFPTLFLDRRRRIHTLNNFMTVLSGKGRYYFNSKYPITPLKALRHMASQLVGNNLDQKKQRKRVAILCSNVFQEVFLGTISRA